MAHNGELNTDRKNRLSDEALTRVGACHLVRSTAPHGPTSAIELDDGQGRCVAPITQFGIVGDDVHEAWVHLTAALPGAR
ncbi:hypothetical protein [Streptomyces sp. NPDC002763]|uniref:hypothetical protein n=1 Tax=Streptomyces sp. NPDC002763 TaxID=3154427 RepID=UPI00333163B4